MSATTELLILQAAPAPIGASALGVPASEADYEAFSETLKAELNSGQAGAENGKSLPQGGENLPDESLSDKTAKAQQTGANPASEQQSASMSPKAAPLVDGQSSNASTPDPDASTSETVASERTVASEMKSAGKSATASHDADDAMASADVRETAAQSASRELAFQPLTDAAMARDVMPNEEAAVSTMNDAPGQWTRAEVSERLDAIWHLLASSGEGTLLGKLDTDLHQKLAHSQHPLAAIEQRLGQLAEAGIYEFTEAAYRDGTSATALTALATTLTSDKTPSAMADSTTEAINAYNALNNRNNAGGTVTPAQSQRLDAIWNMMAASGQGGVQGTISADLHQALAYSDDSLDSIQLRLQTLASEGATHFNKSNYLADQSLSERLITTQEVLGGGGALARANQTVAGSPDATIPRADALGAARLAADSVGMNAASPVNAAAESARTNAASPVNAAAESARTNAASPVNAAAESARTNAASPVNAAAESARTNAASPVNAAAESARTNAASPANAAAESARMNAASPVNAAAESTRTNAASPANAAAESARMNAASPGSAAGADNDPLAGVEVDPRRAAMAFASAQNKPIAGRAETVSPDATAANLTANALRQAVSAPRASESQSAGREVGSSALDRNTAVTLSPAQMAEQRRAGQSVASGVANQGSVTAANLKTSDAGRTLMSASGSADLTPNLDGPDGLQPADVARARMTAALDARPAVSSSAATLDPTAMGQGALQDARLEGRLAQDSGGNRPVSFELPQATNTASSTTAPTVTGAPATASLSASLPSASSAAMRAGGEHVMQNVPWAPQFSDEVGEQVRVFVNNGLQEARLQLTPADLGRVQITINTEGDNARVVFVAETAAARDLLDQSMPRLREMLQQSGIQLAQGDVSDQTESQRRGEGLDDNARRLAQGEGDAQATDAEQALRPQLGNIDGVDGAGRVDTYI